MGRERVFDKCDSEKSELAEPSSWKGIAYRWLAKQNPTTVAMFLMLGGFGWFGWWSVTHGIPAHLETIQTGYERLDINHKAERKEDREQTRTEFDRVVKSLDKQTTILEKNSSNVSELVNEIRIGRKTKGTQ